MRKEIEIKANTHMPFPSQESNPALAHQSLLPL
jgi:hypothetical protein